MFWRGLSDSAIWQPFSGLSRTEAVSSTGALPSISQTFFRPLLSDRNSALYAKKKGLRTFSCTRVKKKKKRGIISFQSAKIKFVNHSARQARLGRGEKQTRAEYSAACKEFAETYDRMSAAEKDRWAAENIRVEAQGFCPADIGTHVSASQG